MYAYFIGYTQNGVAFQSPQCPSCNAWKLSVDEAAGCFKSHKIPGNWQQVSVKDPRLPGFEFHFILNGPLMASALEGKPLEPQR